MMLPATAIPMAAPISRAVSLTADPIPWLSSGVFDMMAVVDDAVASPIPMAHNTMIQIAVQYVS